MKNILPLFLLLLGMMPTLPSAANPEGIIVRLAAVHAEASSASPRIGQISAGTRVSIFGRQGGWKEVFSEQKSLVGWVRSYQVREGSLTQQSQIKSEEDSRGFLSGLASFSRKASRFFSSGTSNTSSGTATIGVRGLSEEQIKSAKPDLEEFAKMKQFVSNDERMEKFKLEGRLQAREVEHVPQRKKQTTSTGTGGEK